MNLFRIILAEDGDQKHESVLQFETNSIETDSRDLARPNRTRRQSTKTLDRQISYAIGLMI